MNPSLDYVDTPSLLVDMDRLDANISEMADVAQRAGVRLRPHIKTHKSPWLAQRQLDAGACGVTVAKLGEAEVMAAAGIRDIRIVYPIIGPHKVARLSRLMDVADVSIAVDSVDAARQVAQAALSRSQPVPLLLEIDTGFGRLGVRSEDVAAAAAQISKVPGIRLMGILTHEGHAYDERTLEGVRRCARETGLVMTQIASCLRNAGFDIAEVSVGATGTARDIAFVPGITEMRPGTYIFNDARKIELGVATEATCALTVLATVVSVPDDDRAVIDAGAKTLTTDLVHSNPESGYGFVKDFPDARIVRLSEEHGIVSLPDAWERLYVGRQIEIIPNHVCPVVNLADTIYLMRNGRCEREIPVAARGKSR